MTNNNDIGKFSFVKSICGIHGTVGVRTHGFLRGRLLRTEDYTELVRPSILSTLLTPLVYYLNYWINLFVFILIVQFFQDVSCKASIFARFW